MAEETEAETTPESASEPASEPEPEPVSEPTTPPTTPTAKDDDKNEATFHAHKSRRVVASSLTNDHDTWMEHLAVVDMLIPDSTARSGEAKYELQIRSFFVSSKTGKKTWDEPPSGADAIEYANEEIRKTAEDQKKGLESVTVNNNGGDGDSKKSKGKLTERVMRLMRRSKKNLLCSNDDTDKKDSDVNDNKNHQESQEFYYDPNTDLEYAMMKNCNGGSVNEADDLKKAIENSINEANDMDKAIANSTSDIDQVESKDENELALATALSLSMKEKAPPKAKNKLLSAYADFERSKKVDGSDNVSITSSIGRRQNILSGYTEEEIAIATHKVNSAKKKSSSAKSKTRPRRRMRA